MLSFKLKNVQIICDNHENLLKENIETFISKTNDILAKAEKRFKNSKIKDMKMSLIRLPNNKKLCIVFVEEKLDNPYFLIYDSASKKLTNQIHINDIQILFKESGADILEEKIKDLENNYNKNLLTEELKSMIIEELEDIDL